MNRELFGNGNTFVTDLYNVYSIGKVGGGFLIRYCLFNNHDENCIRIRRPLYIFTFLLLSILTLYNYFIYFFDSFTLFWLFIIHSPHDQIDSVYFFL